MTRQEVTTTLFLTKTHEHFILISMLDIANP